MLLSSLRPILLEQLCCAELFGIYIELADGGATGLERAYVPELSSEIAKTSYPV